MDYVTQLVSGKVFDKNSGYAPRLTPKQRLGNYINSARKRMARGTYVTGGQEVIDYAITLWHRQKS